MKKNSVKYFLSILISIFQFISFSCDNPAESDNVNLTGTWIHDDAEYYVHDGLDSIYCISRQEYNFLPDKGLKIARKEINKETSMLLGYRYMAEGYYCLSGNQLTIFRERAALNNDSLDHYLNDLSLHEIPSENVTVTYRIIKDTLTFIYPPCGPFANCISREIFYRSDPIK